MTLDDDMKALLEQMTFNTDKLIEIQGIFAESIKVLSGTVDGLMKRVANMEVELIQREQRGGKKRGKL